MPELEMYTHLACFFVTDNIVIFQYVTRCSGGTYSSPNPSKTAFSASSGNPSTPFGPSSHITSPVLRLLTPLLSNFQPFTAFAYRRRSRWNVVPPLHPMTAQPTVRHGAMIMSTRRCMLGFFAFGFSMMSCSRLGHLGCCHTTNALSRVSKPVLAPFTERNGNAC
jgi:hypothetical protein